MENIRQTIIQQFNHTQTTDGLYEDLKSCLITQDEETFDKLDFWFEGIVSSLFYEPNKFCLVLVGEQGMGKTEFFRRLLPFKELYTDNRMAYSDVPDIYNYLIADMTGFERSVVKRVISNEGYIIHKNLGETDKRLVSVCYTTNHLTLDMNGRRRLLVLNLKDIDKHKFNRIDKHKLWIEIYNKFTEKRLFNKIKH
jgi:predicted P-loop ATPase